MRKSRAPCWLGATSSRWYLNFLIIAFALFLTIKGINRLKAQEPPPPPAAPSKEEVLLTEIRDLLKSR